MEAFCSDLIDEFKLIENWDFSLHKSCLIIGCIKIFKSLVHNPDLKELNELRTRIFFFLKLDNGKSGLWVPLNSRLMTSSGHVTKMK